MEGNAKEYEIIEFRGQSARRYPDGCIRNEKGQLLVFPPHLEGKNITSPERASELGRRRRERYLEAIEAGLKDAQPGLDTPEEAVRRIIAKRARVAMTDEGRSGNDAAKLVFEAADILAEKKQQVVQVQKHEYVMDEETRNVLETLIRMKREAQ